jgi:dipeptidyl aminopeptidase/acylaminoacyl peptidase
MSEGRRGMVPEDLTRLLFVSDPQLSPDGRRIAFVVTSLSEERDEYLSNIWVVDGVGGTPRRFTAGPGRDTEPRWSPDGTRLAFLSERAPAEKRQVYAMVADGGEPVKLTTLKHGTSSVAWSPDGSRLAFVSPVGGSPEPESEEEKRKSQPARVITSLKYRFNGEGFIYDRRPHVFVVGADGGTPVQLTDGDFADADPTWSPDGASIVFASARHAERDDDDASDLWRVAAAGGTPLRLTTTAGPVMFPAFSPDGRQLAYLARPGRNAYGRNVRVYTMPSDGGPAVCVTDALDRSCGPLHVRPLWSPDGGSIVVAAEDHGEVGLWRAAVSGSPPPGRLVRGERVVHGFSASADGRLLAFAASDPVAPAEIFVAGADGRDERQLTRINQTWTASVTLSAPEGFRLTRAGFEIDGWVMRPTGFVAGRRYPALLNIHGGPHAQYGHGLFDEFQVYAGAGYAVIYMNPRGSQGCGEAFAQAVVGDWGGGDYEDVMAGLDEALRQHPWIDPDRLGVLGGSYGGFLTSWIVGHTPRFRAACSERAVNCQYTMFGTSDIGHSFNVTQLGGALPWEDMARYIERSPLTYVKDIVTPLLIIHSEDDLRCPIEQAEQLFVALKKLRREVRFVRFPGENHELSRSGKPRHRLQRFRHILDWFGEHLAPEAPARSG